MAISIPDDYIDPEVEADEALHPAPALPADENQDSQPPEAGTRRAHLEFRGTITCMVDYILSPEDLSKIADRMCRNLGSIRALEGEIDDLKAAIKARGAEKKSLELEVYRLGRERGAGKGKRAAPCNIYHYYKNGRYLVISPDDEVVQARPLTPEERQLDLIK